MPPSTTPLRAPPRQNARSQFASTPRFLLSQSQSQRAVTQHKQTSILAEDEDPSDPFSQSQPAPMPARSSASRSRQKEVIEDSGSDLDFDQDFQSKQRAGVDDLDGDDEIPSSLPPAMAEEYAELEDLFRPVRPHRTKRRRVSVSFSIDQVTATDAAAATPRLQKQKQRPHDCIETSSPEPFPHTADSNPPSPSLPYRTTPQKQKLATPQPSLSRQNPATPATDPSKSSTRSYPRFLPPSSSARLPPKPTFVLPRSPSPEHADDPTIPMQFSPSSHALGRRGRQRSSAPSYLPGGMASEVRSWILEMGVKREQQIQIHARAGLTPGRRTEGLDFSGYSLVFSVYNARQSTLGSCGPLAFVQGKVLEIGDSGLQSLKSGTELASNDQATRNVLLMGAPRLRAGELRPSSKVPQLQAGIVIGVLRGLVWEIGLGSPADTSPVGVVSEHERILQDEVQSGRLSRTELGKWTVGMEWEVIEGAPH